MGILTKAKIWCKSQLFQIKKGGKKSILSKFNKIFFYFVILFLCILYFPLFLMIRMTSKYYLIRFGEVPSRRIGHFIIDVNLYLYNLKKTSFKSYDFFYTEKPVSNYALLNLFKRHILVYPKFLIYPFSMLNKINYLGNQKHNILLNEFYSGHDLRLEKDNEQNINLFNKIDIEFGNSFLNSLGISSYDKFVCFLCRDEEYYKHLFSKTYDLNFTLYGDDSKFRNTNINNFELVCEYLVKNGYYIFRMGEKVSRPFSINDKRYIDYAISGMRTEFLDLFLAANCEFFLSTGSGIDSITRIFNKPRVRVSNARIAYIDTTYKKDLCLPKHFYDKRKKKKLSLEEFFDYGLSTLTKDEEFKKKNIILNDSTPAEIKNATIEMVELIENNFEMTAERQFLERKFWNIFKKKMKEHKLEHLHNNYFASHTSISYLKENKHFLSN